MNADITTFLVPIIGWVASIEYRLGVLTRLKETVEKTDAKVEKLVDHLIAKPEPPRELPPPRG